MRAKKSPAAGGWRGGPAAARLSEWRLQRQNRKNMSTENSCLQAKFQNFLKLFFICHQH